MKLSHDDYRRRLTGNEVRVALLHGEPAAKSDEPKYRLGVVPPVSPLYEDCGYDEHVDPSLIFFPRTYITQCDVISADYHENVDIFMASIVYAASDRILQQYRMYDNAFRAIYIAHFAERNWAAHLVCYIFDQLPVVLDEFGMNQFTDYFTSTLEEAVDGPGLTKHEISILTRLQKRLE